MTGVDFVIPSLSVLDGYLDALRRGWSADNVRGAEAARDEIEAIRRDPAAFVATKADDRTAAGSCGRRRHAAGRLDGAAPAVLQSLALGRRVLRQHRITLAARDPRPAAPHVLGHIGYSVVPWKRGRGYATKALMFMIDAARAEGLPHVELTTDPDNVPSQKVILANCGVLVERLCEPEQYGVNREGLRYRIALSSPAPG